MNKGHLKKIVRKHQKSRFQKVEEPIQMRIHKIKENTITFSLTKEL